MATSSETLERRLTFSAVCRQRPTRKPCCGGETTRCRCKIRYISKFTAASRGSPCDRTAFLLISVISIRVVCHRACFIMCVVYDHCIVLTNVTMADKKVTFGFISNGKQSVHVAQAEWVCGTSGIRKGTIHWRCKLYQKSILFQGCLITERDQIVSDVDPEHNHGVNKESVLTRQAVSEMKTKMGELSAAATNVIVHVSRDLEPGVLTHGITKETISQAHHVASVCYLLKQAFIVCKCGLACFKFCQYTRKVSNCRNCHFRLDMSRD